MKGWGIYGNKTFILLGGILMGMFLCFSVIFLTQVATEAQNELEAERRYEASKPIPPPTPLPICDTELEYSSLVFAFE